MEDIWIVNFRSFKDGISYYLDSDNDNIMSNSNGDGVKLAHPKKNSVEAIEGIIKCLVFLKAFTVSKNSGQHPKFL